MLLGYCRTSTVEQIAGLEAQERDLLAQGCERLWKEQTSEAENLSISVGFRGVTGALAG